MSIGELWRIAVETITFKLIVCYNNFECFSNERWWKFSNLDVWQTLAGLAFYIGLVYLWGLYRGWWDISE